MSAHEASSRSRPSQQQHIQQQGHAGVGANSGIGASGSAETSVPVLRVMRLLRPELHQPTAGHLLGKNDTIICYHDDSNNNNNEPNATHVSPLYMTLPPLLLHTSLCLPNSLAVYVGETFTAYLGILNSSSHHPIRRLTVSAQLQTPSQRWQLPSKLSNGGGSGGGGIDVSPEQGVDAIVSHAIEESGQHILRVEVGYLTTDGGSKTFRKFYRFHVAQPIVITSRVLRSGDAACFLSVAVELSSADPNLGPVVMSDVSVEPTGGLTCTRVGRTGPLHRISPNAKTTTTKDENDDDDKTAVDWLDESGMLKPGGCFQYMFRVEATSKEAILKGIAAGDILGRAIVTWRKAMGETGVVSSANIVCPKAQVDGPQQQQAVAMSSPASNFVVHQSGLSVDVAASAAMRGTAGMSSGRDRNSLAVQMPITVEPIEPPTKMELNIPFEVQFLVVNHSEQPLSLQFQFRLSHMSGLAVCGHSFISLGGGGQQHQPLSPHGGSTVVTAKLVALAAGLLQLQGCTVVDLVSGREFPQPALFNVFVVDPQQPQGDADAPAVVTPMTV